MEEGEEEEEMKRVSVGLEGEEEGLEEGLGEGVVKLNLHIVTAKKTGVPTFRLYSQTFQGIIIPKVISRSLGQHSKQ